MEAIKAEELVAEQCMLLVVVLLPILTACNQENIPDQDPLSSRENDSNDKETVFMTTEEGAMSAPALSPPLGVRTVSFLTDHQLELGTRALQATPLLDQDPTFWFMQGSNTANSFGRYRLELAVDLTEEEGD